jgi:hypothetical protein
MTSGTVAVEPAHRPEAIAGSGDRRPVDRGRRRFTVAVLVALVTTTPPGSTSAPATVTDVTPAPPSMALSWSLVQHLGG